jgi:hypothetical protein
MRWWLLGVAFAAGPAVEGLLARYGAQGATAPDATRGAALWTREFPATDSGGSRSCTTCHGPTLGSAGRHATTGEPIEPMTQPGRLADAEKIEKWFGRNCRWTLGRDCTPAEKADLLLYLSRGGV